MKNKPRVTILAGIVILLFSFYSVLIVSEGLAHCCGKYHFRRASEDFNNGEYVSALKVSLIGVQNTIEGGFRWTFGKPHLFKAQTMLFEGIDLYGALDECEQARAIIGSTYDDEGGIDYLCYMIRLKIDPEVWANPTKPIATKTLEP